MALSSFISAVKAYSLQDKAQGVSEEGWFCPFTQLNYQVISGPI